MSERPATTHAIDRCSPYGTPFVGICRLCGATGLHMEDVFKPCPNQRGLTEDEALLESIDPNREPTHD